MNHESPSLRKEKGERTALEFTDACIKNAFYAFTAKRHFMRDQVSTCSHLDSYLSRPLCLKATPFLVHVQQL